MDLNRHMHERNVYKNNPPDFIEIARLYPEFEQYIQKAKNGKVYVNFRDPSVVAALSKCLFHKDFGLSISLPCDRLAPTIPSRLNYLLWLEDLIGATGSLHKTCTIVDIGTGSSCVYPLLGMKINPHWEFVATEVDEKNIRFAERNVRENGMDDFIRIIRVEEDEGTLLSHLFSHPLSIDTNRFLACMCNPPFFSSDGGTEKKIGPVANSSCQGVTVEMVTEGGDLSFALRLVEESIELRERVIWYTIMLGKKSSFVAIKKRLHGVSDVVVNSYEFCQGRTVRWGIAWTFCIEDIYTAKLPQSTLRMSRINSVKPITFTVDETSPQKVLECLQLTFRNLQINVNVLSRSRSEFHLKATAESCTWVHMRKRSRKRKAVSIDMPDEKSSDGVELGTSNSVESHESKRSCVLECDIFIALNTSNSIELQFKTDNSLQKENLNNLVVYLKRSIFKCL